MTKRPAIDDPIEAVALLEEPNRRRLYELVAATDEPIGRDDAALAVGISRELAAFHLDRLAESGILETEYRRRSGRTGPGAGRPAKLYRRATREVEISLPARRYGLAADLMATALERLDGSPTSEVVSSVARERGTAAGAAARREAGARPGRSRLLAALLDVLREAGYEPKPDPSTGAVRLRNCPYDALASDHRDLTCGMNRAWAEGVVDALGAPMRVELAPEPGHCCVVFHPVPRGSGHAGEADSLTVAGSPAPITPASPEGRGGRPAEDGPELERDLDRLDDDGGRPADS